MVVVLSPKVLKLVKDQLSDSPVSNEQRIERNDHADNYSTQEGGGVWIHSFMRFIRDQVRVRGDPEFRFSCDDIFQNVFEEIEDPSVRSMMIDFTNECYEMWWRNSVSVPDWGSVSDECRDFCDGCDVDGAWTEREDETLEFTCMEDCDSFMEHVDGTMLESVDINVSALERMFNTFAEEKGYVFSPPEPSGTLLQSLNRTQPTLLVRERAPLPSIRSIQNAMELGR
jgi:hypothetical protein